MAATTVWFLEIPITLTSQISAGFLLLENNDHLILEDASGDLQQEGALANPIRDSDKTQLLIGCTLTVGAGIDVNYLRRYLNDKGAVS